jgi:hypothetical protein
MRASTATASRPLPSSSAPTRPSACATSAAQMVRHVVASCVGLRLRPWVRNAATSASGAAAAARSGRKTHRVVGSDQVACAASQSWDASRM